MRFLDSDNYSSTALFYIYNQVNTLHFSDSTVFFEAERVKNMLNRFVSTSMADNDWLF